MKFLKHLSLAVALGAFGTACSNDGPVEPTNGVVSIIITAPQTFIAVGKTVQFAATPYDSRGNVLSEAITWETTNPSVATVSNSGLVTGVTEGTAQIRAKSGSKQASVSVTVTQDYCANALSLSPGEVKILAGPAAVSCVKLAATTGPTDFLFITANATPVMDNMGFYTVNFTSLGAMTALSSEDVVDALDPRRALARSADQFEAGVEERIRQIESGVVQRVLRSGNRPSRAAEAMLHYSLAQAAAPKVGDTLSYRVPNINSSKLCTNFTDVRAAVKAVGRKALIVQDVTAPLGGFSDNDFQAIATEFDNVIFETDTLWFGSPTDRNADGLVTILYTPEVNRTTPAGSTGFTAGFFWGGDLFKASEYPQNDPCPQTNAQEIFYALVPDPSGAINGNVRTTATVRQNTRGVIAHELQHMINQGVRMFNPAVDSLETPWLNEGLSHFAEEIVGRRVRGFGESQALRFDDVSSTSTQDDYNAFFRQNLARLRSWMQRPDTSSPTSIAARNQLAPRGAAWLLTRYATDQFGGANPRNLTRRLAAGPDIGIRNFVQHTGASFDEIISGFLLAVYADDAGVPGLAARYTVPSWNVRDVMTKYNNGAFPLLVNPLPNTVSTKSLSGSGNYFRLTRPTPSPQTTFQMQGSSGGPVAFDGARVYVLRLS